MTTVAEIDLDRMTLEDLPKLEEDTTMAYEDGMEFLDDPEHPDRFMFDETLIGEEEDPDVYTDTDEILAGEDEDFGNPVADARRLIETLREIDHQLKKSKDL